MLLLRSRMLARSCEEDVRRKVLASFGPIAILLLFCSKADSQINFQGSYASNHLSCSSTDRSWFGTHFYFRTTHPLIQHQPPALIYTNHRYWRKKKNSYPQYYKSHHTINQVQIDFSAHEAFPGVALFVAASKIEYNWDLIYRYSSLKKLIRMTALYFEIIARLRKHPLTSPATIISLEDIEFVKIFWVGATQAAFFLHEIYVLKSISTQPKAHAFSRLTAFLDH